MATALILTALKGAVWLASGSVSILASLADSGLDVLAALGTFLAVRYAAPRAPDAEHRFGHGKAEAFASLFQAGLVFASAALIGEAAIVRVLHPQPVADSGGAIRGDGRLDHAHRLADLGADAGAAAHPFGRGDRRPRPLYGGPGLQCRRVGGDRPERRSLALPGWTRSVG